jgi:hypothetical protein
MQRLLTFYAPSSRACATSTWSSGRQTLQAEHRTLRSRGIAQGQEHSALDRQQDTMVVTFGEVAEARAGPVKRQYWAPGAHWQIFFEGVIG